MSPDFAAYEIAAAEFIPAKVNQYSKNFRKRRQGYIWRNRAFAGGGGPDCGVFLTRKSYAVKKTQKKALREEARRIKAKKGHVFRRCKKGASLFRALFQTIGSNVIYAPA